MAGFEDYRLALDYGLLPLYFSAGAQGSAADSAPMMEEGPPPTRRNGVLINPKEPLTAPPGTAFEHPRPGFDETVLSTPNVFASMSLTAGGDVRFASRLTFLAGGRATVYHPEEVRPAPQYKFDLPEITAGVRFKDYYHVEFGRILAPFCADGADSSQNASIFYSLNCIHAPFTSLGIFFVGDWKPKNVKLRAGLTGRPDELWNTSWVPTLLWSLSYTYRIVEFQAGGSFGPDQEENADRGRYHLDALATVKPHRSLKIVANGSTTLFHEIDNGLKAVMGGFSADVVYQFPIPSRWVDLSLMARYEYFRINQYPLSPLFESSDLGIGIALSVPQAPINGLQGQLRLQYRRHLFGRGAVFDDMKNFTGYDPNLLSAPEAVYLQIAASFGK